MTAYPPGSSAPDDPTEGESAGNGLGIAALVLGIIALIFAFVPVANILAAILALVGLILGIIGLALRNRRKAAAIAGTVLNAIALILSVALAVFYTGWFVVQMGDAIQSAVPTTSATTEPAPATGAPGTATPGTATPEPAPGDEHRVVYEVTGTATDATIVYFDDITEGGLVTRTSEELPFTEEIDVPAEDGFSLSVYTITATNGAGDAGPIGCTLTIDGVVVSEHEETGAQATVVCSALESDLTQ